MLRNLPISQEPDTYKKKQETLVKRFLNKIFQVL